MAKTEVIDVTIEARIAASIGWIPLHIYAIGGLPHKF
jgi:hypothetical protein